MVRVSRKVSLNESLECGCLSQATMEKPVEAYVWVLLTYACGVKPLPSNCLLEATRYKSEDSGAVSCWWTVVV